MPSYEIRLPSRARCRRPALLVAAWALLAAVTAAWLTAPTTRAVPRLASRGAVATALAGLSRAQVVVVQRGPMAEGTSGQTVVCPAPRALTAALVASDGVTADCGCPATARLCFAKAGRSLATVELVHGRALRWIGAGPRGLIGLTRGSAVALCGQLGDLGLPVGRPQWEAR